MYTVNVGSMYVRTKRKIRKKEYVIHLGDINIEVVPITAFSTLTGSAGEAAAIALFGRGSSAAGGAWGVGRLGASTAGDFRGSVP
jgi:hypothetical protein